MVGIDELTWLFNMFRLFMCVSPPLTMFWLASRPGWLAYKPIDGDVTFTVLAGELVAFARYAGYCADVGYLVVSEANICGNKDMLSPFIGVSRGACLGEGTRFCGKLLYIKPLSAAWLFMDTGFTRP